MRLMHAMAVVLFRRGATELAEQWVARALASGAPQDKRELHELKLFEARLQKPAHPTGRNSTVRELAPASPRARAGLPTPKRPVEGEFDWEPMESGQAGRRYFVVCNDARYRWSFGAFKEQLFFAPRRGQRVRAMVSQGGSATQLEPVDAGEALRPLAGWVQVRAELMVADGIALARIGDMLLPATESIPPGTGEVWLRLRRSTPRLQIVHGENAALTHALDGGSKLSEVALFDLVKQQVTCMPAGVRTQLVSALVAKRIPHAFASHRLAVREGLIALHVMVGAACENVAEREAAIADDVVAAALWKAFPEPHEGPGYSLGNRFVHATGPLFWKLLRALGDLGYSLDDLEVKAGVRKLVLLRRQGTDSELPEHVHLVLQLGREDADVNRAEMLLGQCSETAPRLLLMMDLPHETAAESALALTERMPYARMNGVVLSLVSRFLARTEAEELLREARRMAQAIINPVAAFPGQGDELMPAQFVPRSEVVARLYEALHSHQAPVAIYCMRKAGKTAAARLLALYTRKVADRPIDCRRISHQEPDVGLDLLERAVADSQSLVLLDEFDVVCRRLASEPERFALRLFEILRTARQRVPVLCLGLDTSAFAALHAAVNPYQFLPRFQLPYFDERESHDFAGRVAGALRIDDVTRGFVFEWSGGHPAVMHGLLNAAMKTSGLTERYVPRTTQVRLSEQARGQLFEPGGSGLRSEVLARVLETRRSKLIGIEETWSVATEVACCLEERCTRAAVENLASRMAAERPGHEVVDELVHWGLLREASGSELRFGIPLLRAHLRLERGLHAEEPS